VDWDEALTLNSGLNMVEMFYDELKNDLEMLPLKAHLEDVLIGLVFVSSWRSSSVYC